MKAATNRAALAALALAILPACVMTTFEGPGDPPRVAVAPTGSGSGGPDAPGAGAEPMAGQPTEIAARHLLVSYQGALRASPSVTRSKVEAKTRAEEALQRAKAGESFETLVKEFSDEPGAAERGGSLGRFGRGMMVPAFEKAAFKLTPGAVSDLVETQFGFHVIQRTE
ncbi:MAG: Peptidyl-prolyl cis-trans isomerase PpiD [Polyangiaceae bacterium]|nr:Peptidyl-prolyl cis-trans isomerase PpiD [Polyangiaceae bacterium]